MATGVLKKPTRIYGPDSNGIVMTPRQFDRAEFAEGYRYELLNGVLVVSSTPSLSERDPNQALGRWLLDYQEHHPEGIALDFTIHEHIVQTGGNRRRADRVIWSGLGRLPKKNETPAIVVEFVSAGKRNIERDYETKRDEYLGCGVREYWIFDRFEHSLTVFQTAGSRRSRKRVFTENQIYSTDLLPGFRLHLERLFALADRWPSEE
jgi:Uma2 family endonuclease